MIMLLLINTGGKGTILKRSAGYIRDYNKGISSPTKSINGLCDLANKGILLEDLSASPRRVFAGFAIAAVNGRKACNPAHNRRRLL